MTCKGILNPLIVMANIISNWALKERDLQPELAGSEHELSPCFLSKKFISWIVSFLSWIANS